MGLRDAADRAAETLYARAVERARQPPFYTAMAVPDTHDGRLELVQLHVILLLRRLQRGDAASRAVGQALFDTLFADLDRSLREGGVGDLSVGGWVKKIAQQFYARATAVEAALARGDRTELARVLAENVLGDAAPAERALPLADYVLAEDAALAVAAPAGRAEALHFRPIDAIHARFDDGVASTASG